MRRTPIRTATAVKAAVAAAAFGGLIAGCSPVQMGAAATVGSQSISTNQLNSEVANLSQAAKPYSHAVQLTAAQIPRDVLGWLIRFQVRENLAAREHLTVTPSQRDQALEEIYQQASAQAQQQGVNNVSLTELAVANGLPPNLLDELGRYQAVEIAYAEQHNGGKLPTATASVSAITKQFNTAECHIYQSDPVKVNPQFGTLNYTQYSVVAAPDTLSRAAGTPASPSTAGSSPSC
ncbi:MAG TPA: SurA N-terminal domain-containing protein [Streptosporangiaceae bacterium]